MSLDVILKSVYLSLSIFSRAVAVNIFQRSRGVKHATLPISLEESFVAARGFSMTKLDSWSIVHSCWKKGGCNIGSFYFLIHYRIC